MMGRLNQPNMIVIAEGTRKLLGNLFQRSLKASPDRRVWAALRASSVEIRFEALHASGLTALVGREEESELLLRRWAKQRTAKAGWCSSLASPASAKRSSRPRFWNAVRPR
jgi:hypothetical protein